MNTILPLIIFYSITDWISRLVAVDNTFLDKFIAFFHIVFIHMLLYKISSLLF